MFSEIVMPLIIGLALFLFGMKIMELALHRWAGSYLKMALEKFTETPLRGMVSGTALTAVLQSSTAVTVIVIGFVNAGMLSFPRTLGIILGTNIGTCLTVELISLDINHFALPTLIVSLCVWLASWLFPVGLVGGGGVLYEGLGDSRGQNGLALTRWLHAIRYLSMAVGGFACLLLGMEIMHSIAPALQARGLMTWFLEQSQRSMIWGVLAGALLTAIIQSSTATIAITMGLATAQVLSVDLGIAIVLGANIGTCGTAFLANIGGTRSGQLVAWSHIILNIGGAALFFPFIPLLQEAVVLLTTVPSVQLAHSQTLFNIMCSLIALPICYMGFIKRIRVT